MQIASPQEKLDSDPIFLKRHTLSCAADIFAAVEANRTWLREFLPWVDKTLTLKDEIRYLEHSSRAWEARELFDYGIFASEQLIGTAGFHTISWENERCEIGYWLTKDYSGQGIMGKVVRALSQEAFALGFYRLEIRCDQKNERSARVAIKAGFNLDGVLRGDQVDRGRRRDTLIFSKIRNDAFYEVKN